MDFAYFVETPLLWIVSILFILALLKRGFSFLYATINGNSTKEHKGLTIASMIVRSFIPYHVAATKRPFYAISRYLFHICLFVVPLWFSGHVVLWEESLFQWGWTPIPDGLADVMTLFLLFLGAFFLLRRILVPDVRRGSSFSDWVLIVFTAMPFLSGYMVTHGDFVPGSFPDKHLMTIHILTGEALILMAAFLFVKTRIKETLCTGCSACEINCPADALEAKDSEKWRTFDYAFVKCISCGECVATCPEGAVELRHTLAPKWLFKGDLKEGIRHVELKLCERCALPFAPVPQVEKISAMINQDHIGLCNKCKEDEYVEKFYAREKP